MLNTAMEHAAKSLSVTTEEKLDSSSLKLDLRLE